MSDKKAREAIEELLAESLAELDAKKQGKGTSKKPSKPQPSERQREAKALRDDREAARELRRKQREQERIARIQAAQLPEAICTLIHEATCTACGTNYLLPDRFQYIIWGHERYGSHLDIFEPERHAYLAHLPRVRKLHSYTVSECPSCIDFEGEAPDPGQRSLFETEDGVR